MDFFGFRLHNSRNKYLDVWPGSVLCTCVLINIQVHTML